MEGASKFNLKKIGLIVISLIIIAAIIYGIEAYFSYRDTHPSTDDAIIETNYVNIAAQVDGNIVQLNVKKNQFVKKEQLLLEINPTPYQLGVNAAKAQLEMVKQKLEAARHTIQATQEKVNRAKIQLKFARLRTKKVISLVKAKGLPEIDGIKASSELNASEKTYHAALQTLKKAKIEASYQTENAPQVMAAQANLDLALYKLKHTRIYAPISGTINNLNLHIGDLIGPGRPLFVIVNTNDIFARANFPETNLHKIKPGQQAIVTVKAYPNATFKGYVDSISHSSSTSFALLPSQNATGNYVAITKRFPIVIKLENTEGYKLRQGMSATVEIITSS